MGHPNQVQYIRPRCPRCRELRNASDPKLRRLGYDLRQVYPARVNGAIRVQCRFCYYSWWSRNRMVLSGVLTSGSTLTGGSSPVNNQYSDFGRPRRRFRRMKAKND